MKLPRMMDERFLDRRRRSTSLAGIISTLLALCLFEWRYFVNHFLSWDLLAIALTFIGIKMAIMLFYYLTD